jgi:hypothetical protein
MSEKEPKRQEEVNEMSYDSNKKDLLKKNH